ncbi:uncharacterized protein BX663DRAFT_60872 [Cokeromyces recurvatus]|uniref:uncharacterized protein n=1 Tax=Cokeromyces recurvatus TaxID=90255 RepID=UPI0022205263|nr:uncharacterized protein BX663DRAFT_60872 [Cokeromyces recurvatus]KAI7903102.1 hypothetical protein BX663DRAFT_60872 [Cokeromyces recurvatus]
MKRDIMEMRTSMVNSLFVNGQTEKGGITPLSSVSIFKRLEIERKKLNHEEELHKIDLLYYHIIDFSTSKLSSSTYKVFTKEERKKYNNDYRSYMNIHAETSISVKDSVKNAGTMRLKDLLKNAKIAIRSSNGTKNKKKVLKICKLYGDILETDDQNKFHCCLNEIEYTHQFIYPALKEVLYDFQVRFKLGEPHLQCAAANMNDDQRTQSGPKMDIIMLHKVHQFAISICEVHLLPKRCRTF